MYKLNLENISASYDEDSIVKNVSLQVNNGELISLLGPSGCGKTTLLKVISGILKEDEGDIYIDGKRINDVKINKRNVVMVFQDYILFPHLNVEKNIGYGLKVRGEDKNTIRDKVNSILDEVELKGYNSKSIGELSGGEKQRVAIARALVVEPDILLMDEPFSNLDANLRIRMRQFTKNLIKKNNMTTILVTHDKEEAFSMSDRVAVMKEGSILKFDTPENLYKNPKSIELAKFLEYENIVVDPKNIDDYQNKYFIIPNDAIDVNHNILEENIITLKCRVCEIIFEGKYKRFILENLEIFKLNIDSMEVFLPIDSHFKKEEVIHVNILKDKLIYLEK